MISIRLFTSWFSSCWFDLGAHEAPGPYATGLIVKYYTSGKKGSENSSFKTNEFSFFPVRLTDFARITKSCVFTVEDYPISIKCLFGNVITDF